MRKAVRGIDSMKGDAAAEAKQKIVAEAGRRGLTLPGGVPVANVDDLKTIFNITTSST